MFDFTLHTYYKVEQSQLKPILIVRILYNQHQISPSYHSHTHTTQIIAIRAHLNKLPLFGLSHVTSPPSVTIVVEFTLKNASQWYMTCLITIFGYLFVFDWSHVTSPPSVTITVEFVLKNSS
jgi:hypothetical protein